MFALSSDDLKALSAEQPGMCVSIYIPTVKMGMEEQTNPIRFKNMLQKAEQKLEAAGMRNSEIKELLKDARELQDDEDLWRHSSDGFAAFISDRIFHHFRLPIEFNETVVVGNRFHIKPLMSLMNNDGQFFVLAISKGANRFLQCTRYGVAEREVPDMPASIGEALAFDLPEEHIQHHAGSQAGRRSGTGGGAEANGIFHGHGEVRGKRYRDIKRYFQQVDDALQPVLQDQDAPMVLAAVEYMHGLYNEVNSYDHLLDEGVTGSPDRVTDRELRKKALRIVEPIFEVTKQEALEKFGDFIADGRVSRTLDELVPDALFGRVATLFVDTNEEFWGSVNRETGQVEVHEDEQPGDEELIDFVAVQTFRHGGTVYAVEGEEMPVDAPAAAVLRY